MRTEMKDGSQAMVNNNGNFGEASSSRFSLLASKDRDFLLSPTGAQVKVSDLDGKVVGLLFAANWYPPCRGFTQLLVGIYEDLKSSVPQFEIVYVSSDEDLDAFNSFYGNMPWLAIPFSDLETKKALNKKYDVEGIPCLILLQPDDGKEDATLRDGVGLIYRYGIQAYPFSKQRLEQLREEDREKRDNQTLTNLLANHNRDYVLSHAGLRKVSFNVKVGDEIKCTIAELQKLRAVPENIPLDIVYEDEHVLVINKSAHMVVHPAPGNTSGTLVNGILHHCNLPNIDFAKEEALSDTEDSEDEFNSLSLDASSCEGLHSRLSVASIRPGIVHRLDKGTSGLLVVAKDEHSHMKLSEQFKLRTIKRVYVSLAAGVPTPVAGRVEVPVGRDLNNRIRMTAVAGPVNSRRARHAASTK